MPILFCLLYLFQIYFYGQLDLLMIMNDLISHLIKLNLLLRRAVEYDCRYPDCRRHYNGQRSGATQRLVKRPPLSPRAQPPAKTEPRETMNENTETSEIIYRFGEAAINPKVNHLSHSSLKVFNIQIKTQRIEVPVYAVQRSFMMRNETKSLVGSSFPVFSRRDSLC